MKSLYMSGRKVLCCFFVLGFFSQEFEAARFRTDDKTVYAYTSAKWKVGEKEISRDVLLHHLQSILEGDGVDGRGEKINSAHVLLELSRILLAQVDFEEPQGLKHNNAENQTPQYALANINDLPFACSGLKEHLFSHGHFGYFPFLPAGKDERVNKVEPRGVFEINGDFVSWLNTLQGEIAKAGQGVDVPVGPPSCPNKYTLNSSNIHLLPNIMKALAEDYIVPRFLEEAGSIVKNLFHSNIVVLPRTADGAMTRCEEDKNNRARIKMTLVYNSPPVKAYKMNGDTAVVQYVLIIDVIGGRVKLITLYPEG